MTTKGFIPVWHAYHNKLLAWIPSVEERRARIQETKPAGEQPLRLRLLKEVRQRERLPKALVQAGKRSDQARERYVQEWEGYVQALGRYDQERYEQAWERYAQARDRYEQASERHVQARDRYKPKIEALHAEECPDCPWDGRTIFGDEAEPWRL